MKTNQQLVLTIPGGTLSVDHKTAFGSLQDVFNAGNHVRFAASLPLRDPADWLRQTNTKEYIEQVSEDIGQPALVVGKGRTPTKAHILVLIDAASYLHPTVKLHIHKTFLQYSILELRDRGGDDFIELNAALTYHAEDVFGKPAHKGHYIQLAKIIKERCGVDNWNTAEPLQHMQRIRIEEHLSAMLRMNVVRDWEHLKKIASTV